MRTTLYPLLLLLLLGDVQQLPAQTTANTDTLVSTFHHNHLVEKHTNLMKFAEEMIAYSSSEGVSKTMQEEALQFRRCIQDMQVWKSKDVIQTNDSLTHYLNQGIILRNKMVDTVSKTRRYGNTLKPVINTILIILGLTFTVLYVIVRWNNRD